MGIVTDYLTSKTRDLTDDEIFEAKTVFKETIRYTHVSIADDIGAGDCQWTEPSGGPMDFYVIHMGRRGFASTADPYLRGVLIHELCHVWQGLHHLCSWSYVAGSHANRLLYGQKMYDYKAGDMWGEYNVEQQAHIVEDWYRTGRRTDSPLYRYVSGNIWCPVRSWFGVTATEIGASASAIKG
ncbi:MAG: hypothetical protein WA324_11430 [Bryobacteraceae bacterium]